jgi:methionyl-tRNA formyltransferase
MLRVVFMGTPDFAVPTLDRILAAGHDVVAVYTRAPKLAGRGMAERPSPIHERAAVAGLPVLTPATLRSEQAQSRFSDHQADVAVVVAYGLILPKPVLDAPRHGCLNLHGSALPRWRGAAPIQRAVMAGDPTTAAMVMRMDEGLDTGPVCLARTLEIGPNMTAGDLHDAMAVEGAELVAEALARVESGTLSCTPQPAEGITYASKIEKAETRIRFDRPATEVHNHIRGLSPFPGAWFEAGPAGRRERMKVLRSELSAGHGPPGTVLDGAPTIACATGAIRLIEVQRAGKRPMSARELMRGFDLPAGTIL